MRAEWVSFGNETGNLAEGKPGVGVGTSLKRFTVPLYGEITGERLEIKWGRSEDSHGTSPSGK